MQGQVILSHGSDSGPDATKVSALATLAEERRWQAQRPDYRFDDAQGHAAAVVPRLERLLRTIDACKAPPVLVGSSMGAFVSLLAAARRPVAGLFLLATPAAIPGCGIDLDKRVEVPALLIHGWRDEVCRLQDTLAWASHGRLPLLILDDDHRLGSSLVAIERQFVQFLDALPDPA